MNRRLLLLSALLCALCIPAVAGRPLGPDDIFKLRDVGSPQLSPDGKTIVFTLSQSDRVGNRSLSQLWVVPAAGGPAIQLTQGESSDTTPRWSPDGKRIAFSSGREDKVELRTIDVETRVIRVLTPWERSNFFHSQAAESLSWSPDSRRIAFVATEPPKQTDSTDPRVITRLQYKSRTSFSDNRRSQIFIVSLDSGEVHQLTRDNSDRHSIAWSPQGNEILCLSNREPDPDSNFNYDIFALDVRSARERRLTSTPGVEMSPIWSPDGNFIAYTATKRNRTTIDSVAEDSHVWVIGREGGKATEVSATLDRRANSIRWSSDGKSVLFLAGDHGKTVLFTVAREGGVVTPLFDRPCQLASLTVARDSIAFAKSDETSPVEVWAMKTDGEVQPLTQFNNELAAECQLVKPAGFRFKSFDGTEIEGWLMRPSLFDEGQKYPLILSIHGGPHGMFGYGFSFTHQAVAAHGFGVLYINPRGSNGYGQKFSDGCLNNWGGGDYQDLMKGVDFVLAKYSWIDANRLGVMGTSYGGFMTNWVITQTRRFKAAAALASLSNLISFYGTSLYQDLIHTEFGGFPWDNYELLWKYSPIRYVKNATTPTLFVHGEQDNDVHITQAEEMYMALRRRGIEATFVRYPREGHGFREPSHRSDEISRVIAWFDRFLKPNGK